MNPPLAAGRLVLILATALAVPPPAGAAELPMQPGMWEISTRMEMTGMGGSMPPQTVRRCVTAAEVQDLEGAVPAPPPGGNGSMSCDLTDVQRRGDGLRWTMLCTGESRMTATGEVRYDSPEHYTGRVEMQGTMQGQAIRMTQEVEGRRVGDCGG